MLENIRNAITRLPMDRLGRNFGGRIPLCSQHVMLRLPWQRPLPSNGAPLPSNGALTFSSYGRLEAERVNQF